VEESRANFLKKKSLDDSTVHIPFHSLQKLLAIPYPIYSSFTNSPPPPFPLPFPQTTSHQSRLPPHHPSPTQPPLLIMKVPRLSLPTSASKILSPCLICSPALLDYSFPLLFSSLLFSSLLFSSLPISLANPITRNNNYFRELCQSNQSNPPH